MASYTLTELNNRSGEVVEAAHEGPVEITSRGKRKFVIMTAAHFDRLSGRSAQRSHHVDHMSEEERLDFIAVMDAVVADAESVDG
jgi:prevent-host-death family protein